jgi:hypothetical protein
MQLRPLSATQAKALLLLRLRLAAGEAAVAQEQLCTLGDTLNEYTWSSLIRHLLLRLRLAAGMAVVVQEAAAAVVGAAQAHRRPLLLL